MNAIVDFITGPHWGWVVGVSIGLGLLWLLCYLIGSCLEEPSSYRSVARQQQEAWNKRELQEHKAVIDALYDRAEQEVQRVIERSEGG
jgi:hypothetical protein